MVVVVVVRLECCGSGGGGGGDGAPGCIILCVVVLLLRLLDDDDGEEEEGGDGSGDEKEDKQGGRKCGIICVYPDGRKRCVFMSVCGDYKDICECMLSKKQERRTKTKSASAGDYFRHSFYKCSLTHA